MKKNIRQIKQELRNFARRGKEDRSPESDAFIDKVHTIKETLWGCLGVFEGDRAIEILDFLRDAIDETRDEQQDLYQHLYDVCAYMSGESDERPPSLDVSETSKKLATYKSDIKKEYFRKVKEVVLEDCEEYFADNPEEIKSLKDPYKALHWWEDLKHELVSHDMDTFWYGYTFRNDLLLLAGLAKFINFLYHQYGLDTLSDEHGDASETADHAMQTLVWWFVDEYGPLYFEQFRWKILGSEYTSPIEDAGDYEGGEIDIDEEDKFLNFTKKSGCHKHFSPLRKKNNKLTQGNFTHYPVEWEMYEGMYPQDSLGKELYRAIKADSYEGVKKAIRDGANRDKSVDKHGYSQIPIITASAYGKVHAVKALIDCGADVNVRHGDGSTPLLVAAYNGYLNVVKVLVSAGADVNVEDRYVSVCDLALSRGHKKIGRYLFKHGAYCTLRYLLNDD